MSDTLIGVLIGGIMAAITSVVVHLLNKHHQDRIQERQIAAMLAVERAKHDQATQEFMNSRGSNGVTIMRDPRVDIYFAEMLEWTENVMRARRRIRWQKLKDRLGICW